jgi:hypothetical protein
VSAVPAPLPSARRVPLAAAVPLAAVAALIGLIAGAPAAPAPTAAPVAPAPATATGGGVQLEVPGGWSRAAGAAIPGLPFRHPLGLRRDAGGLRLTAEVLPMRTRTLLPPALAPGRPAVVRLASGQRAWRYAFVRAGATAADGAGATPGGAAPATAPSAAMLVVWALPTARGVATVACLGPRARAVPPDCAAIARSLATPATAALALGPRTAYRSRLPAVVAALDAARVRGRRALAAAPHARGQVREAAGLAAAHRAAATALAPLARPEEDAAVRGLRRVAAAYDALAAAAHGRRPDGYARARAGVGAAERALGAALVRGR